MSATKTPVSVEEYLHTVYQPGCDYVDGEVLERNMAELDHAWIQTALGAYFFVRRKRIKGFIAMGVPYVWVLDPQNKTAFIETPTDGLREVRDGMLRTQNPAFEVPPKEFFS